MHEIRLSWQSKWRAWEQSAACCFERLKITYRHLLRTKESYRQGDPQAIGSLTLIWSF